MTRHPELYPRYPLTHLRSMTIGFVTVAATFFALILAAGTGVGLIEW
jgi:hypothetical protein